LIIVHIFQGHFVVWRRADNATDFVGQFGLPLLNRADQFAFLLPGRIVPLPLFDLLLQ